MTQLPIWYLSFVQRITPQFKVCPHPRSLSFSLHRAMVDTESLIPRPAPWNLKGTFSNSVVILLSIIVGGLALCTEYCR